jgi:hypothetical protein
MKVARVAKAVKEDGQGAFGDSALSFQSIDCIWEQASNSFDQSSADVCDASMASIVEQKIEGLGLKSRPCASDNKRLSFFGAIKGSTGRPSASRCGKMPAALTSDLRT